MVITKQERQLKVSDRCDSCNAQAWVVAKGISGELYFCLHHFTQHQEALYNWAYEIIDETQYINEKSQSSA